jgi:LL-diaminopimelate aminotransferase
MWRMSERMGKLPPYLFVEIDKKKKELQEKGFEVISFGVGDPDMPTPSRIVEAMKDAIADPSLHHYPFGRGRKDFRKAIAEYYDRHYNASLDPESEVCVLIGSKEGIAHFPLAFLDPGDVSLVPEPGYPVYHIGTLLAGGTSHFMPLLERNGFLPDLGSISPMVLEKAKLLYLNYPNNPTSVCAPREFLVEAIRFCKKHGLILVYDAAYAEMFYGGKRPVSFLSLPGAKEVGIEFHSLSKTYNMTGWRIGFAVGNSQVLAGLGKVKTNLDSGVFQAIQEAAIAGLGLDQKMLLPIRNTYRQRRDTLYKGLKKLGMHLVKPDATFYLWVKVPPRFDSMEFVTHLLDQAGVLSTPGNGFGDAGEGYVRFALTAPDKRIQEAVERIGRIL